MTELVKWALLVRQGEHPEQAAATIRGDHDSEAVRRVTGVLAGHGMPWDAARAKARNLVAVLDALDPGERPVDEVAESLMRDDTVLAGVVQEVARLVVREHGEAEAEASHG